MSRKSLVSTNQMIEEADIHFAVRSDVGLVRQQNEDCLSIFSSKCGWSPNAFVVADGMGGHQHGDVASRMVVDTLTGAFTSRAGSNDTAASEQIIVDAIVAANERIFQWAQSINAKNGIGSTVTCLLIEDATALIAQVGDSTAYIIRNREMVKLTKDHSYVSELGLSSEQARVHPMRNVITRSIGFSGTVEPDIYRYPLLPGDCILISSDGLTGEVSENEIRDIILSNLSSIETVCDLLLDRVRYYGAKDNVTFILVCYSNDKQIAQVKYKSKSLVIAITTAGILLTAIAIALLTRTFFKNDKKFLNHFQNLHHTTDIKKGGKAK